MPIDKMQEVHAAVSIINIDEQLNRIRATTFPNLKESARREYESKLQRARNRLKKYEGPTLSIADLAKEQALRLEKSKHGDSKSNNRN